MSKINKKISDTKNTRYHVPWKTDSEWRAVCVDFYSKDWLRIERAIERVRVWQARMNVLVHIEVTADLFSARLFEYQLLRCSSPDSVHNTDVLKSLLGIALIRFVNGISDIHQTGSVAQSIHIVMKAVGVPVWVVDLRHAATHQTMPDLGLLREAINFSIDWLHKNYWRKQLKGMEITRKKTEQFKTITNKRLKILLANVIQKYKKITLSKSFNTKFVNLLTAFPEPFKAFSSLIENPKIYLPAQYSIDSESLPTINTFHEIPNSLENLITIWINIIKLVCSINQNYFIQLFKFLLICLTAVSSKFVRLNYFYYGFWLQLLLRIYTHTLLKVNDKYDLRILKFLPPSKLMSIVVSVPGVYTHATVIYLLDHFNTELVDFNIDKMLEVTKWQSLAKRGQYCDYEELRQCLPSIVKIAEDSLARDRYHKTQLQDKHDVIKRVDELPWEDVPIGGNIDKILELPGNSIRIKYADITSLSLNGSTTDFQVVPTFHDTDNISTRNRYNNNSNSNRNSCSSSSSSNNSSNSNYNDPDTGFSVIHDSETIII